MPRTLRLTLYGSTLARLAIASLSSLAFLAAAVDHAAASRPFSYAALHRSSDPRKLNHWLLIKTVTGADEPKRITVRSSGVSAPARELKGRHGRWVVSRRTPQGRGLIRALRSELQESDHADLRAVGHYKPCAATFRVRFRITAYNKRAPSHFEDATGCA